jgi:hypothetical protein
VFDWYGIAPRSVVEFPPVKSVAVTDVPVIDVADTAPFTATVHVEPLSVTVIIAFSEASIMFHVVDGAPINQFVPNSMYFTPEFMPTGITPKAEAVTNMSAAITTVKRVIVLSPMRAFPRLNCNT